MSKRVIPFAYLTVCMLTMTAYLVGCATTGPKRAERATSSMRGTKDELVLTKDQVKVTMTLLNTLVGQSAADLGTQYKQFVREVKNTDKRATRLRKQTEKMNAQSGSYFDTWQMELETIQNPDIRKRSEERRAKAFDSYKKIDTAMQAANESLVPFISDLQDIQRYLGNDLTAQGIAAISDVVKKTNTNAGAVEKKLDAAIAEIDRVAGEMSYSTPPPQSQ